MENNAAIAKRMANKNYTKSLIELDLRAVESGDVFGTVPYENVEFLKFTISEDYESTKVMPFNQLFPKLQRLKLKLHADIDYDFIDCELPHLKSVSIGVSEGAWERLDQINGLFRKNPQIRSVEVDWSRPDYIIDLSKMLPNLQNLTFHFTSIQIENETVHFENVDTFSTVRSPIPGTLKNLSFSKLKNLTLSYNFRSDRDNQWIEFFKRHQSMTELHLSSPPHGMTIPLVMFTADLTNLVDVTVQSDCGFDFETISRFINNHNKLMKFKFPTNEPNKSKIVQHFEHDWHIQHVNESLFFKRKTTV